MIFDQINYIDHYKGLGFYMDEANDYIKTTDFSNLQDGKYPVDGDHVFALVQSYQTKPREKACWEAHKKYIDIQYIYEGTEIIGYQSADGLEILSDYDEIKGIRFLKDNFQGNMLNIGTGAFTVFYPNDAHMPCVNNDAPAGIKKIILKVLAQ